MSNDAGKSYKFDIKNGVVTRIFEVENGYLKLEHADGNETWTVQGTQVVKIKNDHGNIETTIYSDPDGDGFYVKGSELNTPSGSHVETSSESHEDSDDQSDSYHDADSAGSLDDDGSADRDHHSSSSGTTPRVHDEDEDEDVSDGHDGYEFHRTTDNDHELHGNDLHDSVLFGAQGDDRLVGGARDDILDGHDGNNSLEGGNGDDILVAGGESNRGQNHLNGGSGDDILVAGGTKTRSLDDFLKANPVLSTAIISDPKFASLSTVVRGATDDTGGGAVNIFELHSGSGHDLIFNFHASSDRLQIDRGLNGSDIRDSASLSSHIHVSEHGVTIDLGKGNSVTLVGVHVEHLSAANLTWI